MKPSIRSIVIERSPHGEKGIMIFRHGRFHCITILATLVVIVIAAQAQQPLAIVDVDTAQYPTMKARFFAFDTSGSRLENLVPASSSIIENGAPRNVLSLTCPTGTPVPISVVLAFDASKSMGENGLKLNIAKSAASIWVNTMPLDVSECAITSFDLQSRLNQDFTSDRTKLLAAINTLSAQGATDFDVPFFDPPGGAVTVAGRGRFKRIVLMISDGNAAGTESLILARALQNNVTIYTITLGAQSPFILRDFAERTGGAWFENVTTTQQAQAIFLRILYESQNVPPCEITWQSAPGCDEHRSLQIGIANGSMSGSLDYIVPTKSIPGLVATPSELDFGPLAPGVARSIPLTLTALNGDITISAAPIDDPHFSLNPPPVLPLTVRQGASITLPVWFRATDSSYTHGILQLTSNGCIPSLIHMTGGFPGHGVRTLAIVQPNGGEIYKGGMDATITWNGVLPTNMVRLEYSTDAGTLWTTIVPNATGLQHIWNVPNTASTACLVRATAVIPGSMDPVSTVRNGHSAGITAVAVSPDSRQIATASEDWSLRVWDIGTASTRFTLQGHSGPVRSVAYSPDGEWIASASDDGTIVLWDANTGKNTLTLDGHVGGALAVCFSPDSRMLATAGSDNTVKLWDISDGTLIRTLQGHEGAVTDVSFSPNDNKLVTASVDGTARIWNMADGLLYRIFRGHTAAVRSASFNPNGTTLITAGDDGTADIWDIASGQITRTLAHHTTSLRRARFSLDGRWIATAGDDSLAILWNAATGDSLRALVGHRDLVRGLEFSPNNKFLVTGSLDTTARIWQLDIAVENADTSDLPFTITSPALSGPDTLDFGEVLVGTKKDLIVPYLRNTSASPIAVSDIKSSGPAASAFSVVAGLPPFSVDAGLSHDVGIRFSPPSIGAKICVMEIVTELGTLRRVVRGVGIDPRILVRDTISVGSIRCENSRDTTVVIENPGQTPLRIDSVHVSGADSTDFIVRARNRGTLSLPIIIQPGRRDSITIQFSPRAAGRRRALLMLHSNAAGNGDEALTINLTAIKDSVGFRLSSSIVDFGATTLGTSVTRTLTITNTGTGDLTWKTPVQIGPYTIESIAPQTIPPDGSALMTLRYDPKTEGERSDMIYALIEPLCGNGIVLTLQGASVVIASALLQVPDITAAPGERIEIPIMLRNERKLADSRTTVISLWIRFDASLLLPIDDTPQGTLIGTERSIRIDAQLPAVHDSILIRLPFMAALGEHLSTPITIDTAAANRQGVTLSTISGSFTLANICQTNDDRLIRRGEFGLQTVRPNPLRTTGIVQFALSESGPTKLWLADINSREILVIVNGEMNPGVYEATLDAASLSPGTYYCLLETPTDRRVQRVIVVK